MSPWFFMHGEIWMVHKKTQGRGVKKIDLNHKEWFLCEILFTHYTALMVEPKFCTVAEQTIHYTFFPSQKLKKKSSNFFTRFPKNFSGQNLKKKFSGSYILDTSYHTISSAILHNSITIINKYWKILSPWTVLICSTSYF